MNSIKTYLNSLGRTTRVLILALAVVIAGAGVTQAATTISTNISTGGTLSVTGLATLLGGATTTQITLLSGDTIKNAVASTTNISGTLTPEVLTVTGATTLASTTATSFKVGQIGSQLTRVVASYCATAASDITASTTTMLTCTPVAGTPTLVAADRVIVMATSSLPGRIYIQAASSTAAGTIQVNVFNTGINGGAPGSAVYAFNFWAFQP